MLKLYYAPRTVASAIAIALNEGVHWEAIRVDFKGGEQTKPEYHKINPKGRVPVLATPEGPLTETGAILEYLGDTALPHLVPADPLHRARMREAMYYFASTVHVAHAHKMRGYRWADEESSYADMKAKVPETMTASAEHLEELVEGPYLFGGDITLADPYLYTMLRWMDGDGVNMAAFPKLLAFQEAMEARPSVQKAIAERFFG